MQYAVGVDLGGTNIKAGIVNEDGEILARARKKTRVSGNPLETAADLWEVVQQVLERGGFSLSQMDYIGIGCPGTVDPKEGILRYACNLELSEAPLSELLQKHCGKPVYLENDANCAILGEAKLGAAKGAENAVVLTLGTGIGGGILIGGNIYSGFNFFGGEIGHMVIESGGELCSCGRRGCFERYASASALVRMTKKAMEESPETLMWEICGWELEKANGVTPFEGKKRGDAKAEEVLKEYFRYLADGITNVINIFQPEVLVIGGGLSGQGDALLKPLKELVDVQVYSRNSAVQTKIVISQLGNDAGMIGAAFLGA